MAFKHDPVVVGLRSGVQATAAPKAGLGRPAGPAPNVPRPAGPAPNVPPPINVPPPVNSPSPPTGPEAPTSEKTPDEWRVAYTDLYVLARQRERKLQWIAAIGGVAGLGVGLAFGAWQGSRRSARALPEPE